MKKQLALFFMVTLLSQSASYASEEKGTPGAEEKKPMMQHETVTNKKQSSYRFIPSLHLKQKLGTLGHGLHSAGKTTSSLVGSGLVKIGSGLANTWNFILCKTPIINQINLNEKLDEALPQVATEANKIRKNQVQRTIRDTIASALSGVLLIKALPQLAKLSPRLTIPANQQTTLAVAGTLGLISLLDICLGARQAHQALERQKDLVFANFEAVTSEKAKAVNDALKNTRANGLVRGLWHHGLGYFSAVNVTNRIKAEYNYRHPQQVKAVVSNNK